MVFQLTIETDNDAFVDNPYYEIIRILKDAIASLELEKPTETLCDINGNGVGAYIYKEGEL